MPAIQAACSPAEPLQRWVDTAVDTAVASRFGKQVCIASEIVIARYRKQSSASRCA
jgi:hypothetical protein